MAREMKSILLWLIAVSFQSITDTLETSHLDVDYTDGGRAMSQHGSRRKLIVSSVLEEPYMMLRPDQAFLAGNERFEGYLADILSRLSLTMGFDYELRLVKDGLYGSLNPLGFWDGMIGEVVRGEADLAAGPLSITPRRAEVLDFTQPFMSLRSTAIIRKPSSEERRDGYSRIRRVDNLMQSNLTYGVLERSLTEQILRTSHDPLHRTMWSKMSSFWPPAHVLSTQEGVERARHEDYAYILDTPKAEYVINRKPCDFYIIEPFLDIRKYAFAMRKGDELVHIISMEMDAMTRSQEMQFMFLKWWESECDKKPKVARKEAVETTAATTVASPWRQATSTTQYAAAAASNRIPLTAFSILICSAASLIIYFKPG